MSRSHIEAITQAKEIFVNMVFLTLKSKLYKVLCQESSLAQ